MATTATENPLIVEHEPPLGWMIINRPHVRNALNFRAWQRIVEAVDELNANPDVRVIIMRGVTSQAFISGADIFRISESSRERGAGAGLSRCAGERG